MWSPRDEDDGNNSSLLSFGFFKMPSTRNSFKVAIKREDEENECLAAEATEAIVSTIVSSRVTPNPKAQGTGIPKNKRKRKETKDSALAAAIKDAMESDTEEVSLASVPPRGLATMSGHRRLPTFDDPPLVPEPTPRRNPARHARNRAIDHTPVKSRPRLPTIRSPGNLKKAGNTTESADHLAERFGDMYLAEFKGDRKNPLSEFERLSIGKAPSKTDGKRKAKISSDEEEYDFALYAERGEMASDSEPEEITVLKEEEKRLQVQILEFTKKLSWSKGSLWDIEENDPEVIREKIEKCENTPYVEQREETRELVPILKRMLEILELAMQLKEASVDFRTRINKVGLDWEG